MSRRSTGVAHTSLAPFPYSFELMANNLVHHSNEQRACDNPSWLHTLPGQYLAPIWQVVIGHEPHTMTALPKNRLRIPLVDSHAMSLARNELGLAFQCVHKFWLPAIIVQESRPDTQLPVAREPRML